MLLLRVRCDAAPGVKVGWTYLCCSAGRLSEEERAEVDARRVPRARGLSGGEPGPLADMLAESEEGYWQRIDACHEQA